ncbi:MAG: RDD family protein [Desulfobacterales bacterium]
MNFYYAEGEKQIGPIGKTELQALVKAKKVTARTLVWQEGMESWQELGLFIRSRSRAGRGGQNGSVQVPARKAACSECGRAFAEDEMIRFQESWVCAGCKPVFIQKIKEGLSVAGAMNYAGFWIRFAALAIDGFILWILNLVFFIPIGILMPKSPDNPFVFLSFMPLIVLIQYAIPAAYDTWFVGKYGATPGKMACSLKVVVEDGSRVTFLRAMGRHFAKWLSSMILLIGFIMAAFDDQKRTLHDRICETRVVRK